MSTLKLENIKHENSSTNNMVMDSDGSTRTTGIHKVDSRLQVGNSSITQAYPQNNFGYVADFQASAGTQTFISIATPQTASLGSGGVVIGEDATDTYITQRGNKNIKLTTQDITRMNISGDGNVTLPHQIGFSYLGSKSYVIGGTGTTAMSSSNVWASNVNHAHNRGSHFNASTGRFTCPIAGRYQFHFRCQASNFGSGYLWFYMRLNQSVFSYSQKSQENAHTTQYLGGILELNANDYVDVAWTNNYVSGQIHYPEFTGQLIG